VVADVGAGVARIPGEQSGVGAASAVMEHVLISRRLG
jgi:hypothetical protein